MVDVPIRLDTLALRAPFSITWGSNDARPTYSTILETISTSH